SSDLLRSTADLVAFYLKENPQDFPKNDREAWNLFGSALMRAKELELDVPGLTREQATKLLEDYGSEAKLVMQVGLSGAVWMAKTKQKLDTGLKWAGSAALIGLGAL